MRAVIDNDLKSAQSAQELGLYVVCIRIANHNRYPWIVILQRAALWIDVASYQALGVPEIFRPHLQRPAILYSYFQKADRVISVFVKNAVVLI
jgi:hypothetical protein